MPRGFKTSVERLATTQRAASAAEAAPDRRAERRDRIRTGAQVGTLVLQLCTVGVTAVVAYAAIMGIRTLEVQKQLDERIKETQELRVEVGESRKVVGFLNEEIAALDAHRSRAEAELEQTRLRVLQAEAREKQAAAKLQAATSEVQRHRLIAEFYGRVSKACVATRDQRSFELCIANVLAADPQFQQLTSADAKAIRARASPPPPTASLSANPTAVRVNGSSTLSWSSTNASSCKALGGWSGTKATSGSEATGALSNSTTYTLQCTGGGGSAGQSVTVTATPLVASNYQHEDSGGGHVDAMLLAALLALVSCRRRHREKMGLARRSRRLTRPRSLPRATARRT